jgi:hypothetical protein
MQAKSSNVFFEQGEIEHRRAYSDFIFPGNGWRSMSYINQCTKSMPQESSNGKTQPCCWLVQGNEHRTAKELESIPFDWTSGKQHSAVGVNLDPRSSLDQQIIP